MKFGETLRQRSIPQWSYYNVDYNGLKQLIKERTTDFKTNPVPIPGQEPSDDAWVQLESELFPILWEQHERVGLFTKSKFGEIKRRLDQVERQIERLTQESQLDVRRSLPVHHTRKYARLVQATESISEDIQSLSQFANTQRLAFKKILKKYRRWTGSSNLQLRMNKEILNQPTSFLRPDLNPFLERLAKATSALNSMAAPKHLDRAENNTVKDQTSPEPQKSTISQLHEAVVQNSPLKFDAVLVSTPLGHAAGRATYWIHPDNISEVEVLLLRHMRPWRSKGQGDSNPQSRTHSAMFDNLQRYVREQGATTVAQLEDVEGSFASKVALNVLWAEEADGIIIASDLSPVKTEDATHRRTSVVRRTELPSCLGDDTYINGNSDGGAQKQSSQRGNVELREFMAQHRDVKPLAEIHSARDRFSGLNNSKDVGVWAVLERDITMSSIDITKIGDGMKTCNNSGYSSGTPQGRTFPFAVLQIRWEFSRVPEIVRSLDNSHLVERVRGFTLETQAIYDICSPQDMPKPLWQPLLGKDIRKVPPIKPKRRKARDGSKSPEEFAPAPSATSSGGGPSDSVFSSTVDQSSATSVMESGSNTTASNSPDSLRVAFGEQKALRPKKHVRLPHPAQADTGNRYWNEFDDGSEFGDDTSYAIYVSPEQPLNFPGMKTASKAFSALYEALRNVQGHLISRLPSTSRGSGRREREPLLATRRAVPDLEDSSDSDGHPRATDRNVHRNSVFRARSSIASSSALRGTKPQEPRERLLLRTYIAAFVLSFVVLVVSSILKATGRNKARVEVDTGVIIGVTMAMFCGIGGVALMISRRDALSLLHRLAVVLAFSVVCGWSGYILALVGSIH